MKILQLTKKFPYPVKDGEAIAITNLSKALGALGCEVTLLSMNTKKHFFDTEKAPANLDQYKDIHSIPVDSEVKIHEAFLNLFSEKSYHIQRFISDAFDQKLQELLSKVDYDVVQLETLYLAPYIPTIRKYSNALVAMRAHNVEHEIWQRITQNTTLPPKKWYLGHLTNKLKQFETTQLDAYDILVPITNKDLAKFQELGFRNGAKVTPIGVDYREHPPDYTVYQPPLSLSFIGSLDWMPNQEGLTWFLEKIWPATIDQYPNLKLHIAGRNCPDWIRDLAGDQIQIHGEVPCAATFVNQYPLSIVPLLSGSGMRAKILEAMALGKVVITTSVGLEGIPAKHRQEVLIADTPKEFLDCFAYCHEQISLLQKMGQNAYAFVHEHYDNLQIAQQLINKYQSHISTTI